MPRLKSGETVIQLRAISAEEIPPQRVDAKAGIIYGVACATAGEAEGHDLFLDGQTIDTLVELSKQAKHGVKSRFGHPMECKEAAGTFLGRLKDWRREEGEDIARADLHLDKSAQISPDGNLSKYVLTRAESDPDSFGLSVVVYGTYEKVAGEDEDGNPTEEVFLRPTKLAACDVVDEPAANESLLSELAAGNTSPNTLLLSALSGRVNDLLDDPNLVKLAYRFLNRICKHHGIEPLETDEKPIEEQTAMPTTLSELEKDSPELLKQIQNEAKLEGHEEGRKEGEATERERCLGITKSAVALGVPELAGKEITDGAKASDALSLFSEKRAESIEHDPPVDEGGTAAPSALNSSPKAPETYEQAVASFQALGMDDADSHMRAAQNYESLHEEWLKRQPAGRER